MQPGDRNMSACPLRYCRDALANRRTARINFNRTKILLIKIIGLL